MTGHDNFFKKSIIVMIITIAFLITIIAYDEVNNYLDTTCLEK